MRRLIHTEYVEGMPKAPSSLAASEVGYTHIVVNWVPVFDGKAPAGAWRANEMHQLINVFTGYKVEIASADDPGKAIETVEVEHRRNAPSASAKWACRL